MLSTPTHPTISSRAAGKARATDVGIRARTTSQVQAQAHIPQRCATIAVRQPSTISPHELHRRSPSASAVLNFCPSEYHVHPPHKGELAGPVPKPNVKGRPSDADLRHGALYVTWARKGVLTRLSQMPQMDVPPEEESEYRGLFNTLWGHISEMEPLLPLYACWMAEDTIKQLVTANVVVKQQRLYLGSESPRFILNLQTITLFIRQIEKLREAIAERQRTMQRQASEISK
ncbi:hypothetical protein DAEQUDRAFT_206566 [Daedalea quercina L-15889]|uniref:Uncharacterized protein n=1 Tax=Daedalea quercina L-15889 TaxID=1314783 RepID=A0A165R8T1_9APHY|nr:hypothetical protein DAEQUDRAFT_206566 [Daedalea quercina L-15889]